MTRGIYAAHNCFRAFIFELKLLFCMYMLCVYGNSMWMALGRIPCVVRGPVVRTTPSCGDLWSAPHPWPLVFVIVFVAVRGSCSRELLAVFAALLFEEAVRGSCECNISLWLCTVTVSGCFLSPLDLNLCISLWLCTVTVSGCFLSPLDLNLNFWIWIFEFEFAWRESRSYRKRISRSRLATFLRTYFWMSAISRYRVR